MGDKPDRKPVITRDLHNCGIADIKIVDSNKVEPKMVTRGAEDGMVKIWKIVGATVKLLHTLIGLECNLSVGSKIASEIAVIPDIRGEYYAPNKEDDPDGSNADDTR